MPKEAITVEQALLGYTRWAAESVHEEHIKGSLKPGLLADAVLLDTDLTTCAPEAIERARVQMTVAAGEVVYDRAAELSAAYGDTELSRIYRAIGKGMPRCPCCH